jgi:cobalt-zinc-cadmium efflux system outer membrane protein
MKDVKIFKMSFLLGPLRGIAIGFGCICLTLHLAIADAFAVEQFDLSSSSLKASAQESLVFDVHQKLSLVDCFNRADKNNKEILVAATKLSIAQAAIVIAKAIPNPTFSMLYGWGPAWAYVIAGNGQQVGWAEEIQVAGKRTKKIDVARSSCVQNALQIEAARFSVHNRVRRAYAELAAARAYADLIESQRGVALKLFEISKRRVDAGKAPGAEVLQAKLGVMQYDTQRNQAQGRLVQDSVALNLLLGETPRVQEIIDVDDNPLFALSAQRNDLVPDLEHGMPSLSQLLPTAWHERNDLKAAIQLAYVQRKALTLAKSARIPDPTVGFQYYFSTYKPFQGQYYSPQPNARTVPFQPGYQVTVQEETPVFYQYQGQVNQAKATWLQQLKQNDLLHAQIATGIVRAYEALEVGRENIKKFEQDLLPVALKVAQLSRRGYELGASDLATAVLAQQQYQQTLSAYFDAVVAYQNAWADLENSVGVPLKL